MRSVRQMVDQLAGLIGTKDVNPWENGFLLNMVEIRDDTKREYTSKQLELIERLHARHFA